MGWPTEPINTLCVDAAGRLWVGSAQGVYRQRQPGDKGPFELVPGWKGGEVNCLAPAQGGGVWIGSPAAGVGRMDEENVFRPRAALTGCVVTSLLEDNHGMLWAGTFGSGLYRLPVNPDTKAGKGTAPDHGKRSDRQSGQQFVRGSGGQSLDRHGARPPGAARRAVHQLRHARRG